MLVTHYREALLVDRDTDGKPVQLESYRLAENEAAFWIAAAHPRKLVEEHGERFTEFLKRVMLHEATLAIAAVGDAKNQPLDAADVDLHGFRAVGFLQHTASPQLFAVAENDELDAALVAAISVINADLRREDLVESSHLYSISEGA